MTGLPTGTVTFLFTDIEGSTRLLGELGERYAAVLAEHRRLLREVWARHGGVEIDTAGDGFFVAFARAPDAVAAAAAAQAALAEEPVRVRIGLHTGTPQLSEAGYVGIDVHRAARIASAGHGGQVLLSQATRDLAAAEVRDLGEHRLKDLLAPERLFQLGEGDFPPLKSLYQSNLPVQPNPLIGRERELAAIGALLHDGTRILTLTGPGGTGKTRLALHAAAERSDVHADGVFFVPLAVIRDPQLVMPAVAGVFGLREEPGESLVETLGAHLREKEALLVLDNFEHVTAAAVDVAQLVAKCRRIVVLATSRERLRIAGERVYQVPPLRLPSATGPDAAGDSEAVELFVSRARAATGDFDLTAENAAAVAAICVALDGLPLAIELAAARVSALPPQSLLGRLDRRLSVLTGGARDADERQRTLRNTIAWSYELLAPNEQWVFASLSVFNGGCRLDAAEALCGPDALEALTSLVEQSLVRQRPDADGEARYWMLETIREYAFEQLEHDTRRADVLARHAEYFVELAERAELAARTGDVGASLSRFDAEIPNLRAAVEWATAADRDDVTMRLVTALWSYWAARGLVSEGMRELERALAAHAEPPPRALLGLCVLRHLAGGENHELLPLAHRARQSFEDAGDDFGLAQTWNLIGRIEGSGLGHHSIGERAWEQALVHAERGNYRSEQAEAMGWLMVSSVFSPTHTDVGIERCNAFLARAGDDPKVFAFAHVERAALEAMRGEFELARRLLAEGTAAFRALGLNVWAANNAQEGFYVEMLAGNPAGAAEMLRESYRSLDEMGERGFLSTIAAMLAHALVEAGDTEEAEEFSRRSESAAAADDVFSQVLWRTARAKALARRGELERAEELARGALALVTPTELLGTHADVLMDLAGILEDAGRSEGAREAFDEAAGMYRRKGILVRLAEAERQASRLGATRA